jgi:hypothetical protein
VEASHRETRPAASSNQVFFSPRAPRPLFFPFGYPYPSSAEHATRAIPPWLGMRPTSRRGPFAKTTREDLWRPLFHAAKRIGRQIMRVVRSILGRQGSGLARAKMMRLHRIRRDGLQRRVRGINLGPLDRGGGITSSFGEDNSSAAWREEHGQHGLVWFSTWSPRLTCSPDPCSYLPLRWLWLQILLRGRLLG